MKQVEHSNSETEHLIDRAFEQDLQRLPKPPNAPSAQLLQKLAATPHLPIAHTFGWFGSMTAKWLIALALGSATAGVTYFTLHTKSSDPSAVISPAQRSQSVSVTDTAHSMVGTVPIPKPLPAITPHRNARAAVSEDSLLREEIAHPTVTPAPDTAKTTIHTR